MKCFDLTLAIIKPNATKVPHVVKAIRDRILRSGFFVIRTSEVHLSLREAEEFYKEHRGKFFYERLSTFLASGPVHVHILAGINSIILWRRILGPARVYQAKADNPNSIRALYGVTDTRNSAHGSDSEQSAIREIHFFFPNFDVNYWHSKEECYFRSCQVKLREKEFVHQICPSLRISFAENLPGCSTESKAALCLTCCTMQDITVVNGPKLLHLWHEVLWMKISSCSKKVIDEICSDNNL